MIAAEPTFQANDAPAYAPMIKAAKKNLRLAGEGRRVRRVADAGYWSVDNVHLKGVEPSSPPDAPGNSSGSRTAKRNAPRSCNASTTARSTPSRPPNNWA